MIEQRNALGPGYAPRIINITSISARLRRSDLRQQAGLS
jgi:hypothetical protein